MIQLLQSKNKSRERLPRKVFTGLQVYNNNKNITPLSLITYYVSIDKLVHTRLHRDEVESEFQIVASTASMLEEPTSILVNKFPISIALILSASNCLRN